MHAAVLHATFLGALALATLMPRESAADPPRTGTPYRLSIMDAPVFGLGFAGMLTLLVPAPPAACLPDCAPPSDLNALDQLALGRYSPTAHTIADVLVFSLVLTPPVLDFIDSGGDGWLTDTTLALQSLVLTQTAVQLTKAAVGRPAPILFDSRVPLEERMGRDASRSFISGHTATAFSAATTYTVTYWLRHPDSEWRWVVLAASHSLALGAGMLKIHAGYHYPTDIMAGALVGSAIGAAVPLLHRAW